jgi:putative chitinase
MVNWNNPDEKVSKYFTVGEFTKRDKRRIPKKGSQEERNMLKLAAHLDKIREDWGHPVYITSAYRPYEVNKEVGGAKNSQHLSGAAVDIKPQLGNINTFQAWLDKRWDKALGYGAKKGFVHIDLREGRIRWNY